MILAFIYSALTLLVFGALFLPLAIPADPGSISASAPCPSGRSSARLTGWMLNNKTPVGNANYDEASKSLEVTVENVALPDGTRLSVLIGEEKIGDMEPLKDGAARVMLSRPLPDGSRVRLLDADRPIVSANLQCLTAATPAPTISASPSQSVSPKPSPSPSAEPTQDPMPKHSPAPSPSPR